MPTYEYECDTCKRTFEVEQRITEAPLTACVETDTRSHTTRMCEFNSAGGGISWLGRSFSEHPDRCACQGDDPTPHRHYTFGRECARCDCREYKPAVELPCVGVVRRLIAGQTGFVLKGSGWFKDGY